MTEKRFTVDDGLENVLCWEINDKENEDMTCGECAKLLNELHEENQELKQEMGDLGTAHAEEINKIEDEFDEEILKLEKENEQLKQELFETSKELLWATSDEVDRALHYEDEVEELRKEIFE